MLRLWNTFPIPGNNCLTPLITNLMAVKKKLIYFLFSIFFESANKILHKELETATGRMHFNILCGYFLKICGKRFCKQIAH